MPTTGRKARARTHTSSQRRGADSPGPRPAGVGTGRGVGHDEGGRWRTHAGGRRFIVGRQRGSSHSAVRVGRAMAAILLLSSPVLLPACSGDEDVASSSQGRGLPVVLDRTDDSGSTNKPASEDASTSGDDTARAESAGTQEDESPAASPGREGRLERLRQALDIREDYRAEFDHGPKGAEYQRYIVIHDTETDASPEAIVNGWDGSGNGVAAHFVIGTDGTIVQCVPLDRIAHHAGFGDTGRNALYGVEDESRDDRVGTTPIGPSYPDYGMNSYSIGIELVHVGSTGADYPEAQLEALDGLIAYIDTYYGDEPDIIDHKAWRSTNSDTSAEFAGYLASYQERRTHA